MRALIVATTLAASLLAVPATAQAATVVPGGNGYCDIELSFTENAAMTSQLSAANNEIQKLARAAYPADVLKMIDERETAVAGITRQPTERYYELDEKIKAWEADHLKRTGKRLEINDIAGDSHHSTAYVTTALRPDEAVPTSEQVAKEALPEGLTMDVHNDIRKVVADTWRANYEFLTKAQQLCAKGETAELNYTQGGKVIPKGPTEEEMMKGSDAFFESRVGQIVGPILGVVMILGVAGFLLQGHILKFLENR